MSQITQTEAAANQRGIWLAIIAVTMFSTSPVFVRWAAPLTAYEITAWRVLTAAIFVGLLIWLQRKNIQVSRRDLPKFLLFGFITAVHFLSYIASLNFTTIAHSLTIVYTAPIFVAIFSAIFLKESISSRKWFGVLIVIIGVAVLAGFEPNFTKTMLLGDGLALISAITFGLYSIAGRSQRTLYPLFTYAFLTYLFAALWMVPMAAANFSPSGYGLRQILSILALGIVPLGLGHTLYNAAIRHMNATYANLIASQEVTGGIILGIIFLQEIPSLNAVSGVIITLVGIVVVLL
jgi:drug/metabolite transporter (DMT)-like permease